MKKVLIFVILCLLLVTGCNSKENIKVNKKEVKKVKEVSEKNNFVSYNGKLKVDGVNIKNQYNETVNLYGISSHGLQWFNDLITDENIKILKNEWNSNVFRLAMYTKEGGYIDNKSIYDLLIKDIDLIISNDMYVIVDWHILSDNNPNYNIKEAEMFFDKISSKYKNYPNIIYEICNEPNGDVIYENDIKPYAENIISVIRKNSKDSIIIVGTPTWSQDVDKVINNKIDDKNVMYAVHFYSGTHKEELRRKVKNAIENNVPVFISEWGTSDASGDGGPYLEEAEKWIDFIKENNLSFINWSLTNKNEKSAILKEETTILKEENLTESGLFVKKIIKNK